MRSHRQVQAQPRSSRDIELAIETSRQLRAEALGAYYYAPLAAARRLLNPGKLLSYAVARIARPTV